MRVFILSIVASVSFLVHANQKSRPPVIIGLAHSSNVWLVGALDSKRIWTDDDRASTLLTSGLSFTLITESGNGRNVIAGRVQSGEESGGFTARIASGNIPVSQNPVLCVSGMGVDSARPWKRQSMGSAIYQKAVAESLRNAGLESVKSARLTQNVRVDLNIDGVEEVLLCAQSREALGKTTQANPGDYIFAGVRFLTISGVKLLPLERHVHNGTWKPGAVTFRYAFLPCADIDGDGRMEIALYESYHEGDSVTIYTFNGTAVKRVLTTGWGV